MAGSKLATSGIVNEFFSKREDGRQQPLEDIPLPIPPLWIRQFCACNQCCQGFPRSTRCAGVPINCYLKTQLHTHTTTHTCMHTSYRQVTDMHVTCMYIKLQASYRHMCGMHVCYRQAIYRHACGTHVYKATGRLQTHV